MPQNTSDKTQLIDPFGRHISYLRLSVTDRCDFRCTYCMPDKMTFLPKAEVLSLEELYRLASIFIDCGINRIRLTGGEPLVRKDIQQLIKTLGGQLGQSNLKELTLTTNGSQLTKQATDIAVAGIKRINISLDSLVPATFTELTRRGDLNLVLAGISAAKDAGLEVKINTVLMRGINDSEIPDILNFCIANGHDLSLIETMPMGAAGQDRIDRYQPYTPIMEALQAQVTLRESAYKTGGPARYFDIEGADSRLGIISPISNNFCAGCNRIRLTCTGQLYLCLGHDHHVDFRAAMRGGLDDEAIKALIFNALSQKPERHDFMITGDKEQSATSRTMNMTGG